MSTETAYAEYDVIIVGAGMAGLALASSLRDTPARVALVEAGEISQQAPAQQAGVDGYEARVSALTPASVELLNELGAWPHMQACRYQPFERMNVWDANGTADIEFTAGELDKPALGYIVENAITLHGLQRSLEQAGNISVYSPRKLLALRTSVQAEQLQEVDLDDGSSLRAQLIVAADGGNSSLREMAGFQTREWDYGQQAIVATVRTEQAHQQTAWQRFLPQGPLAFLPLPGEQGHCCSIVWSADDEYSDSLHQLDEDAFRKALQRAFESRLGRIEQVSRRYRFPLRQKHAVDYVKPGIALIGDAAHVIHPLAGQGVNLGFKDVRVLSEEIKRTQTGGASLGSDLFLQRYQRRRKADNLAMMAAMEGFKRLFGSRQLPLVWLRNAGMRQLNRVPLLKQQIVRHAMGV